MSLDEGRRKKIISREDRMILQNELDLLDVIHHRNKNQHRGATWYRYLKCLRASLRRLLSLPQPCTDVKLKAAQRLESAKLESEISREMEKLSERYCTIYSGFSQIIGTGQYVALGMVLLAVLARVWCVLRIPETNEHDSEEEVMGDMISGTSTELDYGIVVARDIDAHGNAHHAQATSGPIYELAAPLHNTASVASTPATVRQNKTKRSLDKSSERETASQGKSAKKKKKRRDADDRDKDEIDSIFG